MADTRRFIGQQGVLPKKSGGAACLGVTGWLLLLYLLLFSADVLLKFPYVSGVVFKGFAGEKILNLVAPPIVNAGWIRQVRMNKCSTERSIWDRLEPIVVIERALYFDHFPRGLYIGPVPRFEVGDIKILVRSSVGHRSGRRGRRVIDSRNGPGFRGWLSSRRQRRKILSGYFHPYIYGGSCPYAKLVAIYANFTGFADGASVIIYAGHGRGVHRYQLLSKQSCLLPDLPVGLFHRLPLLASDMSVNGSSDKGSNGRYAQDELDEKID